MWYMAVPRNGGSFCGCPQNRTPQDPCLGAILGGHKGSSDSCSLGHGFVVTAWASWEYTKMGLNSGFGIIVTCPILRDHGSELRHLKFP